MKFFAKFKGLRIKWPSWVHLVHHSHNVAHCTYLGAVWHEAHGFYGQAAGILLILTLLSFFVHDTGVIE